MRKFFSFMQFSIRLFGLSEFNSRFNNFISPLRPLLSSFKCISNGQARHLRHKAKPNLINSTWFIIIFQFSLQIANLILQLSYLTHRLMFIEFHYLLKLLFLVLDIQPHLLFISFCLFIYLL